METVQMVYALVIKKLMAEGIAYANEKNIEPIKSYYRLL
jgi:hypothetical protein